MELLKRFNLSFPMGRCYLHLAANSNVVKNTCWVLRKQARRREQQQAQQQATVSSRYYDRKFYQPRHIEERLTAIVEKKDVQIEPSAAPQLANEDKQMTPDPNVVLPNLPSSLGSVGQLDRPVRADWVHYKPTSLKERRFTRTWVDFEQLPSQ